MLLEVPEGKKRILLHCCCAPCSGAVVECLVQNGLRPTLFFSNSNIVPREEYELRRSELTRYAGLFGLETVDDEYDHEAWLDFTIGHDKALEKVSERGPRCLRCFRFRLQRAAQYAAANGYDVLTTTLASSRWKSLEQVDEAGRLACENMQVIWWNQNWRKGGLQPRRSEIIKEQQFYNQTFCGCEFSTPED
jgi:predicted adenine nucleotide alpha hydrolase (AANH) superfamily ATPase